MELRPTFGEQAADVLKDLGETWRLRRMVLLLAWQDIRSKYKRSVIGPFWLTLSSAIWVGLLGSLWAMLLKKDPLVFIPWVASGNLIWSLINSAVGEGCNSFSKSRAFLLQIKLPLTFPAVRLIVKNLIILAHEALVFVCIALYLQISPLPYWHWLLLGIVLILVNSLWVYLFLGMACARFRDLRQIIASVMKVVFFVTPILWMPDMMQGKAHLLKFNPFYPFLNLVRSPMLGQAPEPYALQYALVITLVGWAVTFVMFAKKRRQIVYWL